MDVQQQFSLSTLRLTAPQDGSVILAPADIEVRIDLGPQPQPIVDWSLWIYEPAQGTKRIEGLSQPHLFRSLSAGSYSMLAEGHAANGEKFYSETIRFDVLLNTSPVEGADRFADRPTVMLPNSGAVNSAAATMESGEPDLQPPSKGSAWWRWTAPANGRVYFTLLGSQRAPWLELFTGSRLEELTLVAPDRERLPGDAAWQLEYSVSAGQTYAVRARENGSVNDLRDGGIIRWQASFVAAPENDDLAKRQPLDLVSGEISVSLAGATREPGEPFSMPASIWFAIVPSDAARFKANLCCGENAVLNLFRAGDASTFSSLVASGASIDIYLDAGQEYALGVHGPPSSDLKLRWERIPEPAIPPNDAFAVAQTIHEIRGRIALDNTRASLEPAEPPHSEIGGGQSVWFRFVAPENGFLEIMPRIDPAPTYARNPAVPVVAVYAGQDLASLALLGRGTADSGDPLVVPVEKGNHYRLAAASLIPNRAGPFWLDYAFHTPAANDLFVNASPLQGENVRIRGSTWGSGIEADEPAHNSTSGGRSVWWRWTAPRDGWVSLICTPGELVVYGGDTLPLLQRVSEVLPIGDRPVAQFLAEAGTSYSIVVVESLRVSIDYELELQMADIAFVQPAQNSLFTFPADPVIELAGVDAEGRPIARAWLFQNSHSLGELSSAPFRWKLADASPGYHVLRGIALNESNETRFLPPLFLQIRPANDDFKSAVVLAGHYVKLAGTCAGAGREPGEPNHHGNLDGNSVWYRWTPPADGNFVFTGSIPAVYAGQELMELIPLSMPMIVQAGRTYYLAVEGGSDFDLQFQLISLRITSPAPATIWNARDPLLLQISTTERPEQIVAIEFEAQLEAEGWQSIAAVASPPFQFLWENPFTGRIAIRAVARLRSGGEAGSLPLTVTVRPANDELAHRRVLSGTDLAVAVNFAGATSDSGSANDPADIWFSWSAPEDGVLHLSGVRLTVFDERGTLAGLVDWPEQRVVVRQNLEYVIRIRASGILYLNFVPRAVNDAFANRIVLSGNIVQVPASSAASTTEVGEPPHGPRSVWWTWTALAHGYLSAFRQSTSFAAYAGEDLAELTPLPAASPEFSAGTTWIVRKGQVCQIALIDPSGVETDISWRLSFQPISMNDDFADSAVLIGSSVFGRGDNRIATREANEPDHGVAGTTTQSLWWTWTAPSTGLASITLAAQFESAVAVYTGSGLLDLAPVALRPLGPGKVDFEAERGVTYQVAVSLRSGTPGECALALKQTGPPPNDLFSDAILLRENNAPTLGWTLDATREFQEPRHAGEFGGRSVWYFWEAPAAGQAIMTLRELKPPWESYSPRNLLAVYEGSVVSELRPVAAGVAQGTNQVTFASNPGQVFAIAIDTLFGSSLDFSIAVDFSPTPPPELRLEMIKSPTGSLLLQVLGGEQKPILLKTSTNLRDWEILRTYPMGVAIPLEILPHNMASFYKAEAAE
ncbi:MAG: hypothetical protein AB1813_19120 [Verrucomicrobiota bacterium]